MVKIKNNVKKRVSKKKDEKVVVREIKDNVKVSEISEKSKIASIEGRLLAPVRRIVNPSSAVSIKPEVFDDVSESVSRTGLDSIKDDPSISARDKKDDNVSYSSNKISGDYVSNQRNFSSSGRGPNLGMTTPKDLNQDASRPYDPNKPAKNPWDKKVDLDQWSNSRSVMGSNNSLGPEYTVADTYLKKLGDDSDEQEQGSGIVKRRKNY
ncbi:MAG: hypothetical protein AABW73_04575 [Nanoarchaeota archaeon]